MKNKMKLVCMALVLVFAGNVFAATLSVGSGPRPEYDTVLIDHSDKSVATGFKRYTFNSTPRKSGQTMTVDTDCTITGITFEMEQVEGAYTDNIISGSVITG